MVITIYYICVSVIIQLHLPKLNNKMFKSYQNVNIYIKKNQYSKSHIGIFFFIFRALFFIFIFINLMICDYRVGMGNMV